MSLGEDRSEKCNICVGKDLEKQPEMSELKMHMAERGRRACPLAILIWGRQVRAKSNAMP